MSKWEDNSIQFPRLLSEVWAIGLTDEQYACLCESMDLARGEIDELFRRADSEFERITAGLPPMLARDGGKEGL